jgi:hypothetical protein
MLQPTYGMLVYDVFCGAYDDITKPTYNRKCMTTVATFMTFSFFTKFAPKSNLMTISARNIIKFNAKISWFSAYETQQNFKHKVLNAN